MPRHDVQFPGPLMVCAVLRYNMLLYVQRAGIAELQGHEKEFYLWQS